MISTVKNSRKRNNAKLEFAAQNNGTLNYILYCVMYIVYIQHVYINIVSFKYIIDKRFKT